MKPQSCPIPPLLPDELKRPNESPVPPVITQATTGKSPDLSERKFSRGFFKKITFFAGVTAVGLAAVFIGLVMLSSPFNKAILARDRDKIQVVHTLAQLKYPDQLAEAKTLCTTRGDSILQKLVSETGVFPASTFVVTKVKNSGTASDIEMQSDLADGHSQIFVHLVNQNGWKFDDIFLIELSGKKIGKSGLWCSYIVENPIRSEVKIHADDWKEAYDFAKDFVAFLGDVKKLSENTDKNQF